MVTTVHGIDHTTLRCRPDELPAMAAFYTDLLGMVEGPRPAFPFPGHWLSLEGSDLLALPTATAAKVIERRANAIKARARAQLAR